MDNAIENNGTSRAILSELSAKEILSQFKTGEDVSIYLISYTQVLE